MGSCVLEGVFLTLWPLIVHKPACKASTKPLHTPADPPVPHADTAGAKAQQEAAVRLHSGAEGSAARDSGLTVTFVIIWLR